MIVSFYAGLLGLLYAAMSFETIGARRAKGISLGVGPNGEISSIVSAHSNFAAYSAFLLLQAAFLELSEVPAWSIHALCVAFTLGRVLHYLALRREMNMSLRKTGMILTLSSMIVMSVLLVGARAFAH